MGPLNNTKTWLALAFAVAVGLTSLAITHGYLFQPAYKLVVVEQVSKDHYTISECIVDSPCKPTKVAHTPRMAQAYVWAYLSGGPVKPDWRE